MGVIDTIAKDEKQARRRKLRMRPLSRVRIAHPHRRATHLASMRSFGSTKPEMRQNAPEWTRTITGKSPHKALNLVNRCHMFPRVSETSRLAGFGDSSDAYGTVSVATVLPRRCRNRGKRSSL